MALFYVLLMTHFFIFGGFIIQSVNLYHSYFGNGKCNVPFLVDLEIELMNMEIFVHLYCM
uniref:Uncharacterized protein n=1 Tax=Rhizophora mucronata TaxID=61149 RepID=A0A2P2QA74_RHIMU